MVRELQGGIQTGPIRCVLAMGLSVWRRSHNGFTEGYAC